MNQRSMYLVLGVVAVALAFLLGGMIDLFPAEEAAAKPEFVNVYTSRHYGVEPVFERFTRETGIQVRFTTGSDAVLRERLRAEGKNTPADVYMAVDAGNLWLAGEAGLLAPIESQVLRDNIPAHLRDAGNRWFGLTRRVRTILYHPDRVNPAELSTYEALTDPKWAGRLVMRPATHSYTQSLVSSLIAAHGPARAEEIVRGWVANRPILIDSDTRILEALAAGQGDVAIANDYYLGRLLQANPQFPIRIFWANQNDRGAHQNISGAGVTTHAPNRANAIKLLEWLATAGQEEFASSNHEFPANPNVTAHPIIVGFGEFKTDPINIGEFGRLQAEAVQILDRAGYR